MGATGQAAITYAALEQTRRTLQVAMRA
jgi:hypothetical protein